MSMFVRYNQSYGNHFILVNADTKDGIVSKSKLNVEQIG